MRITKIRIIFLLIAILVLSSISSLVTYANNYMFNANEVSYDNSYSNIPADNLQGAIDKL